MSDKTATLKKAKEMMSNLIPDFIKDPKVVPVIFALAASSICASAQHRFAGELRIRADGTTTYTSYENGNTQTASQGRTFHFEEAPQQVRVNQQSAAQRVCQRAINDMNERDMSIDPNFRLPSGAIVIGSNPELNPSHQFDARVYYADGSSKPCTTTYLYDSRNNFNEAGGLEKRGLDPYLVQECRATMGYSPDGFYGQTVTGPGVEYSTQTTVTGPGVVYSTPTTTQDVIYEAAETVHSLSHLVEEASGLANAVRAIAGGNRHGGSPHVGKPAPKPAPRRPAPKPAPNPGFHIGGVRTR